MKPKPVLTTRQQEIFDFLKEKILKRGYGPTVREIGAQFGIRSPNGVMCHLKALERKGLISREAHMSRAIQLTDQPMSRSALPMAGRIAAGNPLEALEQGEQVDFSPLFENDDHFCLTVTGESMIEAQIADGDYVVVKRQKTCHDGDIVVALVDGSDATLKKFYREPHRVRLEPCNHKMKPIYTNNCQIIGKVVGVIRKFI